MYLCVCVYMINNFPPPSLTPASLLPPHQPAPSSHLNDLKEITNDVLYENYRTEKLSHMKDDDMGYDDIGSPNDEVMAQKGLLRREEERLRNELAMVRSVLWDLLDGPSR